MTDAIHLRQQAERCQRLSLSCTDQKTSYTLRLLAEQYRQQAAQQHEVRRELIRA